MAIIKLYRVTKDHKLLIAMALLNAGVKARLRVFPTSIRVCFDGSQEAVLDTLNGLGFRNAAGGEFSRFSFNGPGEIFVHLTAR